MGVISIFETVSEIINKIIPDPKQKAEAQLKLLALNQSGELQKIQASSQVVIAEAKSESWLARNWRPLTMLSFTAIIVNNYLLSPWLLKAGVHAPTLEIPPNMWSLLEMGMGGYVLGRSGEKIAAAVSQAIKK